MSACTFGNDKTWEVTEINFADNLRQLQLNAEQKRLREQEEAKNHLSGNFRRFFEEMTISDCLEAAGRGEHSLRGFLSTRWSGGNCKFSLCDFPSDSSVFYPGDGTCYVIRRFGSDPGYVRELCDDFREICRKLGFSDFRVAPSLRAFMQQAKTESAVSGKVKYTFTDSADEYVIYVVLSW